MKELPIALDKKKLVLFCKKYQITYLALFGSILTPHFKESSDVDFLVKFKKNHNYTLFDLVDMEAELCVIVSRKVDLRTPEELSRYFRDDVLAHAEVIYEI